MGGFVLLAGFLFCGLVAADGLFYWKDRLTRIWLGLCAGLIMMMWLPALWAFVMRFTAAAQFAGLGCAAAVAGLCWAFNRGNSRAGARSPMPLWLVFALVVPFALLSLYLQYSHILRNAGGALHVGQSTYGDLSLHLGIATGMRNAAFPPDYTLLPGTLLGYPFLGDSMVTSMLLLGSDLTASFVVTGALMMTLVYMGFVLFAWEVSGSRAATALAFLLMFVNGGLGFLYALDRVWKDSTAFHAIFTAFYATPTNQPDLNLRWVNVICDMMVPQRTLLTGWTVLLPALWILVTAVREGRARLFMVLGIWGGAMPMIHTHSFLALGLMSAGAMAHTLIHASGKLSLSFEKRQRKTAETPDRGFFLRAFLIYGVTAVLLAAPQLLTWSVPQTLGGGSLRLRFNWVNNQGDGRLIDGYCWFWIKNVGLIWLMMIPAALSGKKKRSDPRRMLACGALCIYVVAELIQFQPNAYDNNKLFYVAYMAMLPAVGMYLIAIWKKLSGLRGRAVAAALFLCVSFLSGALSIGREVVSDYELFSVHEAEAAHWIDRNTEADALFLTGGQHKNAVAALAGRHIVCGTPSFLYFHGVDYSQQQWDEQRMLESPADHRALFEQYGIDYIFLSSFERNESRADEAWFEANCACVFSSGDVSVYAYQPLENEPESALSTQSEAP